MKARFASIALTLAVLGGLFSMSATNTAAQNPNRNQTLIGLVNALVFVSTDDIQVGLVNVDRSLNNLRALNNFLNNNDIDITLTDVNVLSLEQVRILELNGVNIGQVIGVDVLSGGDIIVFQ